jgi:hypothetical protein
MRLELVPDRQVLGILEQALQGPYRFVYHALIPYVRIGPALADVPLTVHPTADLCVNGDGPVSLQGLGETMDFAVWYRPQMGLVDVALLPRWQQAHARNALATIKPSGSWALTI